MWGNEGCFKKEHRSMVLSLINCGENFLISGSKDGDIIIWAEMENTLTILKKITLKRKDEIENFKAAKNTEELIHDFKV